MEAFGPMMALGSTALAAVPMFVVLGYLFVLIDRREDRPSKDDKQIGSKLVVWNLTLAGAVLALVGVFLLLKFILGGFKGGGGAVKDALVPLLSGGVTAAAFALGVLPRTNNTAQPQIERFAMGTLAFGAGLVLIGAFYMLIDAAVHGFSWPNVSQALAALVVSGGAAGFALMRHGQLSGWTSAPRPAAPMAPPAGGGYPGGYPQQGGGYPPQGGGGYPPQGGGYPPQGGGGYPPQGGGYPPQGGGGYPPQGGYGR